MVEPEIYDFLGWVSEVAESCGLVVLPEVHDGYRTHERLAAHGLWTYDFVLPGLVLNALQTGTSERLAAHLFRSPDRQFTTLDCHDGIPVRPDLDGIVDPDEMRGLAGLVQLRGGNINRIMSSADATDVDIHQLNCTYYSALDCDDERYVAARAIQLFAKGVPQIYYVGLLAGENDRAGVERTGDGRAINRHNYLIQEFDEALSRPVVRRVFELVRLRNTHPAFDGSLTVDADGSRLRMEWRNGDATCSLVVDLLAGRAVARLDAERHVAHAGGIPEARALASDEGPG